MCIDKKTDVQVEEYEMAIPETNFISEKVEEAKLPRPEPIEEKMTCDNCKIDCQCKDISNWCWQHKYVQKRS